MGETEASEGETEAVIGPVMLAVPADEAKEVEVRQAALGSCTWAQLEEKRIRPYPRHLIRWDTLYW